MMRRALIAGATGLVGGHLLREVLSHDLFESVVCVGRRAPPTKHDRLEAMVTDFTSLPELPKADAAFCCLGTTIKAAGSEAAFRAVDHDAVVAFARACRVAGCPHFLLVTAIGSDATSSFFYNRVKGETEADVRALGFPSFTIAHPAMILGERATRRPAEALAQSLTRSTRFLMRGPLAAYTGIDARDLARGLLGASLSPVEGERVLRYEALKDLAAQVPA